MQKVASYETSHPIFNGAQQDERARRVASLALSVREKALVTVLQAMDDTAPAAEMTTGAKIASIVVQGEMGILKGAAKAQSAPPLAPVVMINNIMSPEAWQAESLRVLEGKKEAIDVVVSDAPAKIEAKAKK